MKLAILSVLLFSFSNLFSQKRGEIIFGAGMMSFTNKEGIQPYFDMSAGAKLNNVASVGGGIGYIKIPRISAVAVPVFIRASFSPGKGNVKPVTMLNLGYAAVNKSEPHITYMGGLYGLLSAGINFKVNERANSQIQVGYGSMSVKAKLKTNTTL